jgi:alpha-tubulin suppressor-like RCC1 family protein
MWSLSVRHLERLAILLTMLLWSLALPSLAATTPLTGIKQISVGSTYACGLTTGGEVKCWGSGEVGNIKLASYTIPVSIPGFTDIKSVFVGDGYTCAITSGGKVKCVGTNLGYDPKVVASKPQKYDTPTEITGLSGITAIAPGSAFMCALSSSSGLYCWGRYYWASNQDYVQTKPSLLVKSDVTGVAVGGSHACFLSTNSKVSCWGQNGAGQVGTGNSTSEVEGSKEVSGLTNVTAILARGDRSCALVKGGTVKCWGRNGYGELGVATVGNSGKLQDVVDSSGKPLTGVTQLALGDYHTCAMTAGAVKCWGRNTYGEVGYKLGTPASSGFSTIIVKNPTNVPNLTGSEVASVATSTNLGIKGYSCALLNNGGVKCWGVNFTLDEKMKELSTSPVDLVVEFTPPPPPPPPTGNGITTKGEKTNANFQNLIQTPAGVQPNYSHFTPPTPATGSVRFAITVTPDPTHVGKAADSMVIAYQPAVGIPSRYMKVYNRGITDSWEVWDGNLATLKPARTFKQLPTTWQEVIYEGPFTPDLVGSYTIFVGYRLSDGTFIFNGIDPMTFYVSQ